MARVRLAWSWSQLTKPWCRNWGRKDAITLSPCEATSFEAMTDAVTAIVKLSGEEGDKYIVANWLN